MKRWIAFLLVICCLVPCLVACVPENDGSTDGTGDNGGSQPPAEEKLKIGALDFGGALKEYVIVYGKNDTESLNKGLAEKLRDVISTNCGVTLKVVADSASPVDKEILVGKTTREQSKYFFEGTNKLDLMECVIGTVDGKVVVTGAMLFSTEEAIILVENYAKANSTIEGMAAIEKDLHTGFAANRGEYRLMEYNVLVEYPGWGTDKVRNAEVEVRKEVIASMILGNSPDVAVLCEVFDNWSNQLPALIQDEYATVQWKRSNGSANRTPIIYKKDRFNLIESGYTDIGVKNESGAVESYKNYRCVTYAVLEDKTTKEKLLVFGTHFESGENTTGDNYRVQQVALLKSAMDKITQKYSGTVVLMGDFNTASYKQYLNGYNALKSTFTNLKNPVESHALASIDQVFVSKAATVNKTHIEPNKYATYASDHKPVIVDITTN